LNPWSSSFRGFLANGGERVKIQLSFSARGQDHSGELEVPVNETALVLVDMWNWHDPEDESAPPDYLLKAQAFLAASREQGMMIMHAPNWPVADRYPQYDAIEEEADAHKPKPKVDLPGHMEWPPRDNFVKTQAMALRNQFQYTEADRQAMMDKRTISRYVTPLENEYIISTHNTFRYALWKQKIKLLIYVGGALNECMLHRDTSLNRIVGSDSGSSSLTAVVLEDCVYAMPSERRSAEENVISMLDYYRRKIAFTAKSETVTF
jgi:hypothetical protein